MYSNIIYIKCSFLQIFFANKLGDYILTAKDETILKVNDLNVCRTFYLDLMVDAQIITEGNFMVKIMNEGRILSLYSPNSIIPKQATPETSNEIVNIILTHDLMNDTYNKLLRHNVKIFSVHYKDNNETNIEAIECCDPENNLMLIKAKEGFSFRKNLFFSRTQIFKL